MRPILTALLLAAPMWAAEVKVAPDVKIREGKPAQISAVSDDKAPIRWVNVHGDDFTLLAFEQGRNVMVWSERAGVYRLAAFSEAGGKEVYVTVTVEGKAPPKPPPPKPDDPPAPKPTGGVRVLIVYESADAAKAPDYVWSVPFRAKLTAVCEKDESGRGWNFWDKDVDASAMPQRWRTLLSRPRPSVPYVHVTRGDVIAHEGPLPADEAAFLALVETAKKGGR